MPDKNKNGYKTIHHKSDMYPTGYNVYVPDETNDYVTSIKEAERNRSYNEHNVDYLLNYFNSPAYKYRLEKYGNNYARQTLKELKLDDANIKQTFEDKEVPEFIYNIPKKSVDNVGESAAYYPISNSILNYAFVKDNSPTGADYVGAHEISHWNDWKHSTEFNGIKYPGISIMYPYLRQNKFAIQEDKNRNVKTTTNLKSVFNNNKIYSHDARAEEVYADLQAARALMFDKGIFDSRAMTKDKDGNDVPVAFTKNHLKQLKKENKKMKGYSNGLRLLNSLDDDALIKAFNEVASNDSRTRRSLEDISYA